MILYYGCDNKEKEKIKNTYYIELVNCNFDSLKNSLSNGIYGKVSFYKNNQLQVLSMNYITNNLPEMHYFNNLNLLNKNIEEGTKKIQIEFINPISYDSVKYSMQKYIYRNKQWKKISDMGIVKTVSNLVQPNNKLTELTEGIVTNIVQYSY
ncbi:MAG TPA: hypothetical protein PK987_02745 [Ferruginibacter sp.]|nr:hypothetical protein [Ferruginibacter sp.]